MANLNRASIEHFGKRLDWVRTNLELVDDLLQSVSIQRDRDLQYVVLDYLSRANPHPAFNERTWMRWRSQGGVSQAALGAICALYPGVHVDGVNLLTCDWQTFEMRTATAAAARTRWVEATNLFGAERAHVERFGKAVYREFDEQHDELPLIALESWIPGEAIPLLPGEQNAQFRWVADHGEGSRRTIPLAGLLPPYHLLKLANSRRKQPLFNGTSYLLSGIRQDGERIEVKLRRGRYFDYVNTCEAHAALLSDLLKNGASPDDEEVDFALGQAGWTRASVLDWNSRTAFIGVNCLLITKNYHKTDPFAGDTLFWLHRRGNRTIEAQGVWHVAPAGGHQPLSKGHANPDEMSVWHTAVRELLEEIFGQEELAVHDREFEDHFQIAAGTRAIFNAVIASGAARIYYLGLGLDPATTKPEMLCTILIDWKLAEREYYQNRTRHLSAEMKPNWEGKLEPYRFSTQLMRTMAKTPFPNESTLPAGAACLLLTARHIENGSIAI